MKLYLIRHGAALDSIVDAERPLSPKGQQQALLLGQQLALRCQNPVDIFHSGILRAEQTAEIIAQHITVKKLEPIRGLMPENPLEPMLINLATYEQDTVLVGHLPFMQLLFWALIENSPDAQHQMFLEFTPATVVCLEKIDDQWTVDWVFSPAV